MLNHPEAKEKNIMKLTFVIFLKVRSGKPQSALLSSHSLEYICPSLPQVGATLERKHVKRI